MATLNIMPLMTDAIMADCGYMPNSVFGAYMKMLIAWWRAEAKPMSAARLRLVSGCSEDEFAIIAEHLTETPEGFIQEKLVAIWGRQFQRSEKAQKKAQQRWSKSPADAAAHATADAAALPQQCNPLTVNQSCISHDMQDVSAQGALTVIEPDPEPADVSRETYSPQGKPPKPKPPKRPPREILLDVLDEDHAEAVLSHRKALRKPLTARAAELLAAQFAKARDGPNAAADLMIARGWQGFEAKWESNDDRRNNQSGNGKPAFAGVVANLREMLDRPQDGHADGGEPDHGFEPRQIGRRSGVA